MLFLVLIHFQVIPSNFTSYPQISYTGGIKTPTLKFLWEHWRIAQNKEEGIDQELMHMTSEGTSDTRNLCMLLSFLIIQFYLEVCFPYYHVAFVSNNHMSNLHLCLYCFVSRYKSCLRMRY